MVSDELKRTLIEQLAEVINKGEFIESTPYYIIETQINEDGIVFFVGNDDLDSREWVELMLK